MEKIETVFYLVICHVTLKNEEWKERGGRPKGEERKDGDKEFSGDTRCGTFVIERLAYELRNEYLCSLPPSRVELWRLPLS